MSCFTGSAPGASYSSADSTSNSPGAETSELLGFVTRIVQVPPRFQDQVPSLPPSSARLPSNLHPLFRTFSFRTTRPFPPTPSRFLYLPRSMHGHRQGRYHVLYHKAHHSSARAAFNSPWTAAGFAACTFWPSIGPIPRTGPPLGFSFVNELRYPGSL